ncbi:hypothetical protein VB738_12725 [Cyanobium gracile UHCC 0139]|uniref:Secreted protein n=1 Tax=Cyanobium gracile UHCC 0139 TaxID=3110308 RepID=A0ABU5RWG7_9CYAN|nr:hypothetical protein [Cyanobium gracile]MEA5392123.1 hypothetical protein [Cyanobium gracile UHCC 0139]
MTRRLLPVVPTAAALLLGAAPAMAAPPVLTIGRCVYRHQGTTGTVETYLHTCYRSSTMDEPIAVDCRTMKVANYLGSTLMDLGNDGKLRPGWQPWETPDPNDESPDTWLLVEAACTTGRSAVPTRTKP